VARILAAPLHQRRNVGNRWAVALVLTLCFAAPVVLGAWSLLATSEHQAEMLRIGAGGSFWIGVGALLVVGWAMFVGNVLQQNHPTLARLLPHHASQLRLALLVGWALACLAATALPGFAFGAPLAWGCGTAVALVLLSAAVRWPLLWLGGIAAPFVMAGLTRAFGAADLQQALDDAWNGHRELIACVIALAGGSVLVRIVREGGPEHLEAYETRHRLRQAFLQQQGAGVMTAMNCKYPWMGRLAVGGRAYAWWMARVLARPRSTVTSRLLLGLGRACHWTTHATQAVLFLVISVVACGVVALAVDRDMFAYVLPWLAFSALTAVCSPALQAAPQLRQTRREQALLALLPGVPRGARLNRWLAWQMSASFLVSAVIAFATAWGLDALADRLRPGISASATGGMNLGVAAVLLSQLAWQWRHWARLSGSTGNATQLPTVTPVILGIGVMALHSTTGVGYVAVGVVFTGAAVAYCAWRWARMGAEPTAFPAGRLS
jgi:hypothetical protein